MSTAFPETTEKIDLSWVTFSEKDPSEPCQFHECENDADWMLTAKPCEHKYAFCDFHTQFTKGMLGYYQYSVWCAECPTLISDIDYKPIKRG